MWRSFRVAFSLVAGVWLLLAASALLAVDPPRLCSGGSREGEACATVDACPGGSCVVAQGVCAGGGDDGLDCDCPGSRCVGTPACGTVAGLGTCAGGPYAGECCSLEYNCAGEGSCRGTQKVCASGSDEGVACLVDAHCPGSTCLSSGRVCRGDGFSCVREENCIVGPCVIEGVTPTPTIIRPTRTPTLPVTPTNPPVPGCAGDCSGDGEVTIDELIRLVNIALEAASLDTCEAGDVDGDGGITVTEIIVAVNRAIAGCSS